MSLILCSQNPIKHPLYIEELGISIYTAQELSYIIYNHPFMVVDGFINDRLILFIEELELLLLVAKLKRELEEKKPRQEDMLLLILQEIHYYSTLELNKYKELLITFRRMHPAEFAKSRGDYYYSIKRYGYAISAYKEILENQRDSFMDDNFISRVWNNLGAAYGGLFWFGKSMNAYEKAYQLVKTPEMLKFMFQITILEPCAAMKNIYLGEISEEERESYKQELETILNDMAFSDESKEIDQIFLKEDRDRIEETRYLYKQWKYEYRKMI